jgi:hypothetical protein
MLCIYSDRHPISDKQNHPLEWACRNFIDPSPINFHATGSCLSSAMVLKPKTKDYLKAIMLFYTTKYMCVCVCVCGGRVAQSV